MQLHFDCCSAFSLFAVVMQKSTKSQSSSSFSPSPFFGVGEWVLGGCWLLGAWQSPRLNAAQLN